MHHDENDKRTLSARLSEDLRQGKITLEGDHAAVNELGLKRNIAIPYIDDPDLDLDAERLWSETRFRWSAHCVQQPQSISYRGLDRMASCLGIGGRVD